MTLLFLAPKNAVVTPSTVTRNRTGVANLVKQAPAGRYPLEWWLAWLRAHW
jgi:hypothetical protein